MNEIRTYKDLLLEKHRLQLLQLEQQTALKAEFEVLKMGLKPVASVFGTIAKMTSGSTGNPFISAVIGIGVNFLLKKVLLRNAGWVTKLFMPVLVKNYLSNEVNEDQNIVQKAGSFLKGIFKKLFKDHQPV